MTRKTIGAGLASMAGLLLVSGGAWAQTTKTPIAGQLFSAVRIEEGEFWVDEEGINHNRGRVTLFELVGDMAGFRTLVSSGNFDPLTGDGDAHGATTFVGTVLGGDPVECTGRQDRESIDFVVHIERVEHCSDGSHIKTTSDFVVGDSFPRDYVGVVLHPPSRRGRLGRPRR
jgi:hypothetical protein